MIEDRADVKETSGTDHVVTGPGSIGPGEPVFLVPGFLDSSRAFGRMAMVLSLAGFHPIALDVSPSTGVDGIDVLAGRLSTRINAMLAPGERFSLIGHSMGGLIARYYLQRLGGLARVRRFVSLSSPHRGTALARLLPNAAARQMRPGSRFLCDLNNDVHVLAVTDPVSVWTPFDLMILPAKNCQLPVGRSVQIPVLLHPWMTRDPRVIGLVREILAA
jgi:triacylglycerol lipase